MSLIISMILPKKGTICLNRSLTVHFVKTRFFTLFEKKNPTSLPNCALQPSFFLLERIQVPIHNGAGTRAQPWVTLMTKKRLVQYTQTPPFNNAPSSRRASSDRLHGNRDNGTALFHIGARVHYTGGLARFPRKGQPQSHEARCFHPSARVPERWRALPASLHRLISADFIRIIAFSAASFGPELRSLCVIRE